MAVSLRESALRQGGVFTAEDVRRTGCSRGRARTLLANGDWVPLRRGVYAEWVVVASCAEDPGARHALATAAALAVTTEERFAAGHSAACVTGLETLGVVPERVTLSAARLDEGAGTVGHGFRAAAARTLVAYAPPEQRESVFGLDCTVVARTAVDLARTYELRAGVVALDSAARQFGTSADDLRAVAALQVGWPYARRTAAALDLMDERTESVLETLGRLSLRFTRLPTPRTQVWIGEHCAEVRADFWIPGTWVLGEGDGRLKYTTPEALWEEKLRQERAEVLGFQMVRFNWTEAYFRPQRLGERFVAAVARDRPGIGRVFPDPTWWLVQRRAGWDQSRHTAPWWLRGLNW